MREQHSSSPHSQQTSNIIIPCRWIICNFCSCAVSPLNAISLLRYEVTVCIGTKIPRTRDVRNATHWIFYAEVTRTGDCQVRGRRCVRNCSLAEGRRNRLNLHTATDFGSGQSLPHISLFIRNQRTKQVTESIRVILRGTTCTRLAPTFAMLFRDNLNPLRKDRKAL